MSVADIKEIIETAVAGVALLMFLYWVLFS